MNNKYILRNFPSTRYQGSKRKIIPFIYESVKNLKFESVLDAFGGSGVVSYLFKKMGKVVTYNDKLKFNYLIGKALIENGKVLLEERDLADLIYTKNVNDIKIVEKKFKNIYYLKDENKWLDNIILNIFSMNHYSKNILEYKKSIAFYALFQSCMVKRPFNLFHRRNLYLRTNNVKRNFGNKTTWDTPFEIHFKKFIDEINTLIFDTGKTCKAINDNAFNLKNVDYDLVYFDPPYLSKDRTNETSNYLKCYHFLEGLTNYFNWDELINYETSNLSFKFIENDFNKDSIYKLYEILFYKFKKSKILFSYKIGGIPSIDYFVKLLKKMGKVVKSRSIYYNYTLSKPQNHIIKKEYLILAE